MSKALNFDQLLRDNARLFRRAMIGSTQFGVALNTQKDVAVWWIKRQPYYGDRTAADESAELRVTRPRMAG